MEHNREKKEISEQKLFAKEKRFMKEAISEAQIAASEGEVPIGAVIVQDNKIIAKAHNLVESLSYSSAHAEIIAIKRAEQFLGSKWLSGCEMYVTLEPCSMCAGAIILARIDRIYIGAMDPKNGACGSVYNILQNDRLNHRVEVKTEVLSALCGNILTDFFKEIRKKKKKKSKED